MSSPEDSSREELFPLWSGRRRFLQRVCPMRVSGIHSRLADQYLHRLLELLDRHQAASSAGVEETARWLREAGRLTTRNPADLLCLWTGLSRVHNVLLEHVFWPDSLQKEADYLRQRLHEIGLRRDEEVQEALQELTGGEYALRVQGDRTRLVSALQHLVNRLEKVHIAWISRDLVDRHVYKVASVALLVLSFVVIAGGEAVLGPLSTFRVAGIPWIEGNVLSFAFSAGLTGACFSVALSALVRKPTAQPDFSRPWRIVARTLVGGLVALIVCILVQNETVRWEMAANIAHDIRSKQPSAAVFSLGFLAGLLERLVFRH